MPSTINLRRKIRSVGNTKQITKAMQMVAASKMRRAQEAVAGTRSYAEAGYDILSRLQKLMATVQQNTKDISHPLLVSRPVKKVALIVISSDKGLAGAYNINVLKRTLQFLEENKDKEIQIITIGRKIEEALSRLGKPLQASFVDFAARPTTSDMRPIAKLTIDAFLLGEYDQVSVVYTKFYSTLRQVAEEQQIVPIPESERISDSKTSDHDAYETDNYLFEPAPKQVLEYIVPRLVETKLLQTVLEATASEHSSRMLAMKNATDNASDLIDDLTLTYNSVRQANITRELAEITSGSMGVA